MCGVEVAMREMVAHPGDLAPRDAWLVGEPPLGKGLDRFADLEESDPHGIEDQTIREVAATNMGTNGLDRGDDIGEALLVAVGHSGTRSLPTRLATSGLSPSAGTRSTGALRIFSSSSRARPRASRPRPSGTLARMSTSLSGRSSPRATLPN